MRVATLWPATIFLAACAHTAPAGNNGGATPAVAEDRQGLQRASAAADGPTDLSSNVEPSHPAREVGQLDRPPPIAAQGPRELDDDAASPRAATPTPDGTGRMDVTIERTATAAPAPSPSQPARTIDVLAPARDDGAKPPAKLGADVAPADVELRERVQRALLASRSLSYTAKHVRVEVAQRDVTLRGEVRTARERAELDRIVRELPGVKKLDNQVALISTTTNPRAP